MALRPRFGDLDADALAAAWRSARPFPHIVVDDLLPPDELQILCEAVARTPHFPNVSDFYEMMASADDPEGPAFDAFATALAGPGLALAERVTGKQPARVTLRSYVYLAGSFLLPHSDQGTGTVGRVLAWTFYLLPRGRCQDGELELFDCDLDGGEIVASRPSRRIDPVGNRFVLFDVSPASLHQVREVTEGARVSLSGWYLR